MDAEALIKGVTALIAMLMLYFFIFVAKGIKKGATVISDQKHKFDEKQKKLNDLIENLSYELFPDTGKIEQVIFYLEPENERLFYDVPSEYISKFKNKIEQNIVLIAKEKSADIYGMDYAVRAFYIGEQRILTWTKSN